MSIPPPPVSVPLPASSPPARLRPGKAWLWVGALAMIVGVVAGLAIAGLGVKQMSDDVDAKFARFVAPGTADITISQSGDYVVYYEYRSEVEGRSFDTSSTPPPFTAVVTAPDGRQLTITQYTHDITFSANRRAGLARYKFHADRAGKYSVAITAASVSDSFAVSVGAPVVPRLIRLIVVAILIGGLCFLTGLVVLVATLIKRRRARGVAPPPPMIVSGWLPGAPAPSNWGAPAAGTGVVAPAPWTTGGSPVPPPPPSAPPPPPPH